MISKNWLCVTCGKVEYSNAICAMKKVILIFQATDFVTIISFLTQSDSKQIITLLSLYQSSLHNNP